MTDYVLAETPSAQEENFQTDRVLTIAAGHAVHDTYTAFLPPLLPAFITNLSLSTTEAGLLSVFLQAPSLVQPLIGHAADRVSLRYFLILSPAVTAISMSLLGLAPGYIALALLLVVAGFSSAAIHSVAPVMAGNLSGNSLGRGMGFWMVGGELGRTLGPIAIVSAVQFLTLEGSPWLMIAGLLASAILYVRFRNVSGRAAHAGQGLPWRQAVHSMGPLLVPLAGLIVVRAFMIASLTTYLPTFLSQEGADLWMAGASLSVLEAAGVAGALLGGSLSDWLGRRRVLLVSLITTTLFMLLFLSDEGAARFPLLLVLGLTSLSMTPVVMAIVQENGAGNRALANGIYMALTFTIQSGAVVAVGILGDLFGLRLAFTVSAVVPLLGIPFVMRLPQKAGR
jgi:FSR family fosmidomycin resistance protein-like MFS transporter